MKYNIVRTETADAGIRQLILYIAQNFGNDVALKKLDETNKEVVIYAVVDQRQDYLNIIRGL